jgi:FtsH-binding integral membrane protein
MKGSKKWYLGAMVILAFVAFICGVQIDSAKADANNLNQLYLWVTIGCGAASLLFLYLAAKTPKV